MTVWYAIRSVLYLSLHLALLWAGATHARDGELQGCWRTEKYVSHFLDGSTQESFPKCVEFIDGQDIKRVCHNRLGIIVGNPAVEPYSLVRPGLMDVSGRFFRANRQFSFVIDKNKLIRTEVSNLPPRTDRPDLPSAVDVYAERLDLGSVGDCLPKPIVVTRADFARYWHIRRLIYGVVEVGVEGQVLGKVIDPRGGDEMFAKGAMAEADRVKAWGELRKIAAPVVAEARAILDSIGAEVEQSFFTAGFCDVDSDPEIAAPEKQKWADDFVSVMIGRQKLAANRSRLITIAGLSPGDLLGVDVLKEMPQIKALRPYLEDVSGLQRLSDLSTRTQKVAETRGMEAPACLEKGLYLATTSLMGKHFRPFWSGSTMAEAEARAASLNERLLRLRDPEFTGLCDHERTLFDVATLKASGGDVSKIKTPSGLPLSKDALGYLPYAYTTGCHVPKSAVMARKLLEHWANVHGDTGKIAESTHCELALWYRYGIGGAKDAMVADRWEKRFTAETGGAACGAREPMDPVDPWRVF